MSVVYRDFQVALCLIAFYLDDLASSGVPNYQTVFAA